MYGVVINLKSFIFDLCRWGYCPRGSVIVIDVAYGWENFMA
jgi:hypothetical protein